MSVEKSLEKLQRLPMKFLFHAHPFRGLTIPRLAVMQAAQVSQYIEECIEFTKNMREIVGCVINDFGKKPFLELYNDVIRKLPEEYDLEVVDEMPKQFFSSATLLNYIKTLQ